MVKDLEKKGSEGFPSFIQRLWDEEMFLVFVQRLGRDEGFRRVPRLDLGRRVQSGWYEGFKHVFNSKACEDGIKDFRMRKSSNALLKDFG